MDMRPHKYGLVILIPLLLPMTISYFVLEVIGMVDVC